MFLLCIFCPPLAVLLSGRPVSAILNIVLTLCFWLPGVLHAFAVVGDARAEGRHRSLVRSLNAAHGVAPPRTSPVLAGIGMILIGVIGYNVINTMGKRTTTPTDTAPVTVVSH